MTATTIHTPWGWSQDIEELVEGVWRVSTAGHGGLKLSRERWYSLPDVVRDTFLNSDLRRGGLRGTHRPDAAGPGRRQGAGTGPEDSGLLRPLRSGAALPRQRRGCAMTPEPSPGIRPRCLPSVTTKLNTELGSLFVTVGLDEDGQPFEVFGSLGKAGSLQHGMTELACRLVSLHLRRGTPAGGNHRSDTGHQRDAALAQPDGRRAHGLCQGAGRRHRPGPAGLPGGAGRGGTGGTAHRRRLNNGHRPIKAHGAVSIPGAAPLSSTGHPSLRRNDNHDYHH